MPTDTPGGRSTSSATPHDEDDSFRVGILSDADLTRLAKGIIESYHYETDFLSELLQNAVDAVRKEASGSPGKIDVSYNSLTGMFSVLDNGIGLGRLDLKKFALGRTDKADLSSLLIGEKGVGGSYVLLISDYFEVESVKNGRKVVAVCENALNELLGGSEPILEKRQETDARGSENYTRVSVKGRRFKDYAVIDDLIEDLLLFTALGNTKTPFGVESMKLEITVSFVAKDDEHNEVTQKRTVPFCFMHPAVAPPGDPAVDLIEFSGLEEEAKKAGGKLGVPDGAYKDKLLVIRDQPKQILAAFGSAETFEKYGLVPMIVLGVKGAPMPVVIKPPDTGYSGYWRNLFVLINKDDVELDIGRKSITVRDVREIHLRLRDFFNLTVPKHAALFIPPRAGRVVSALEAMKNQARQKATLGIEQIPYEKIPTKGEELSVMGIFHELVGAGALKGYRTLSESSDSEYDAIVRYTVSLDSLGPQARERYAQALRKVKEKPKVYLEEGFVEFKVDAHEFMKDCDSGRKHVEDVMLVVAYDLDRTKLRKGWLVDPIPIEDAVYAGAKWKLTQQGSGREVPLLLIKDLRHSSGVTGTPHSQDEEEK
jgi:hypothetical protein